jgi:phosphoribosylaminoimidazolecarboxamide formyltransferase/IMP cyclohydrolase
LRAAARSATSRSITLIEEVDIGGPSLVRAAAKNFRDVLVVVEPADYDRVLAALALPDGPDLALRFDLARARFAHTAAYDQTIASTLQEFSVDDAGAFTRPTHGTRSAARWSPVLTKIRDLRYGENPHQPGPGTAKASAPLAGARASGQGAVVHESARPGRRGPHRARIRRARRRS